MQAKYLYHILNDLKVVLAGKKIHLDDAQSRSYDTLGEQVDFSLKVAYTRGSVDGFNEALQLVTSFVEGWVAQEDNDINC